ncbi:hypothetical protein BJ322DRAFT_1059468, partial [Thelephora terrestris]
MSLEAARNLSIPDLFRVLNEKLNLECTRLQETPLLPVVTPASEVESKILSIEDKARDILEKFIPSFRNLWNLLQPVNRLPQEILPHIARHLLGENAVDARPVIPMTHVCRYWRESIISAPEIWTLISNSQSELMTRSLARVKASRLSVSIDMHSFRVDPGTLGLLTPYLQNIDSLNVSDLMGIEELTRALPAFPQSTPNLRSLKLHCAYTSAKWNPTVDPFGSLGRTLKRLSLLNVPLYPSILSLGNLTDLNLRHYSFDDRMDTLLTFLEHNRSLEKATLDIRFTEASHRLSRRAAPTANSLRHLSILCNHPMNAQALVSSIALRRGAHLEISSLDRNTGLNDVLSDISLAHLSNLPSPAFLGYESYPRNIRLRGPNGSFSFSCFPSAGIPFEEFPLLPLTNVREFRLRHRTPQRHRSSHNLPVFNPSPFPALETLAVECDIDLLQFLSTLLSKPPILPSLKTLAFLNCVITEEFMEKLTQFASDRVNTTSARLHHVVIVHENGMFPSAASIHALGKHVPVVDVRFGTILPVDL